MRLLVSYLTSAGQSIVVVDGEFLTAGGAFESSGLRNRFQELPARPPLAMHGKLLGWDQAVPGSGRLDVLRPLIATPMDARRLRSRGQSKRNSGG